MEMRNTIETGDERREMKIKRRISHLTSLISISALLFWMALPAFAGVTGPVVAGQFYPADKNELSKAIDSYLSPYKVIEGEGQLIALIAPHAGYEFSGPVAGYAFKQLTNKNYDTVIIVGPSHYMQFDGISVIPSGEYATPLGKVKIDEEMAKSLMAYSSKITYVKEAWEKEHSVEVEIPYLQKTLRNFKIVPVIMGYQSLENASVLSEAILRSIDSKKKVLLIASSDMSHYHTSEVASSMDALAIDAISNGDINLLISRLAAGQCEMCGYGPVISVMMTADQLGANSYEILKYADTGDVTGDKSRVVGYMSAAIYKRPLVLDDFDRRRLLEIARKTLESYLSTKQRPDFITYEKELQQKTGVFVTLTENGQLRGCIGYIKPVKPLCQAVADMAVAAATEDQRFTPVTTEELPGITIEVSVLSGMTRVELYKDITIGKHGLYIINGGRSGILLPQVATENHWTRDEFLQNVCLKAGLDPSVLKDPNTELYMFTANVFHEEQ